jgi:hypothetical protein
VSESILPLVEGFSEVQSVPLLLRRLLVELRRPDVQVARPFRVSRYRVVREGELERALQIGLRDRRSVVAVLVLLDADDDEPSELETALLRRCRRAVGHLPSRVVVANRELEAWFLGAKESLRGLRGIHDDAVAPAEPEAIRGAKEALGQNFSSGSYLEVDDQPALMEKFELSLAERRCPSFGRFKQAVTELLVEIAKPPSS